MVIRSMFSIQKGKRKNGPLGSSTAEGLRILTQLPEGDSNVVIKSSLRLNQTKPSSCFLENCFLCKKKLSLDKEVYMYRGDQGFCSVDCRERQMYLDEMKEIESYTKKILKPSKQFGCRGGSGASRCETSNLLEEFRRRKNQPYSCQNTRVVFT